MPIVSDIARQVLSDVSSDANLVVACEWVAKRYEEMVTKVKYRHLRKVGSVIQPATIVDGTITITEGSVTVTPDATALALWNAVPNDGLIGRFLRSQNNDWYEIAQYVGGVITLANPYTVEGGTGIGYNLAARYVALAADARWLGDFMFPRMWRRLETLSLDALDAAAPGRPWSQGTPACVAEVGVGISVGGQPGTRLVEIYPYARDAELITYVYWTLPVTLGFDDEIPRVIPDYTLKEGALINAMRWEASRAARMGELEKAAYWRNEYKMQETKWYRVILPDAARADKGVDDISFMVQGYGSRYGLWGSDIRTAHDQVWSQWMG